MNNDITILWADDEIDLLRPQIIFLEKKGYQIITVSNGYDAIDEAQANNGIDVIFLDESMPGITGLETLSKLKTLRPNIPIVMITKNEAEQVMEEAIGGQISDYLIKPVKPLQILTSLRRLIDKPNLELNKTTTDYQKEFRQIAMSIQDAIDHEDWAEVYKKIIYWELQLDKYPNTNVGNILAMQKEEANIGFSKYVAKNYKDWMKNSAAAPIMSNDMMNEFIFQDLDYDVPSVFILLDNLRFDQWKIIRPIISELFTIEEEDYYYSILPTTTQYSRNAIFSGLMPNEIQEHYPQWWVNDNEKGGKNLYEKELLQEQINRAFHNPIKMDYIKVTSTYAAKQLEDNISNYLHNDLTVIVYNFIDMLSHARTEMEVLKELAGDEKAYRSLTRSWFLHSPLWNAMKTLAEKDVQLFIATDHGSIRVQQPSKVIGDRETTTNLRYKVGRNLQFEGKDVLYLRHPDEGKLPKPNVSSSFIFAKDDKFFLYPNNYNHFNNYYKNTFQHGGISMEEVIIPFVHLRSKSK